MNKPGLTFSVKSITPVEKQTIFLYVASYSYIGVVDIPSDLLTSGSTSVLNLGPLTATVTHTHTHTHTKKKKKNKNITNNGGSR